MPFASLPSSSCDGVVPVPILVVVLTWWCHPVSALVLVWWCCPHPSPLTWWCCPCPRHCAHSCVVVTSSSSCCGAILTLTLCCHHPRSHPRVVLTWTLSSSHPCVVVTVPVPVLVLAWWSCCRHPSHVVVPFPSSSFLCGGAVPVAVLVLVSSLLLSLVPVLVPHRPGPGPTSSWSWSRSLCCPSMCVVTVRGPGPGLVPVLMLSWPSRSCCPWSWSCSDPGPCVVTVRGPGPGLVLVLTSSPSLVLVLVLVLVLSSPRVAQVARSLCPCVVLVSALLSPPPSFGSHSPGPGPRVVPVLVLVLASSRSSFLVLVSQPLMPLSLSFLSQRLWSLVPVLASQPLMPPLWSPSLQLCLGPSWSLCVLVLAWLSPQVAPVGHGPVPLCVCCPRFGLSCHHCLCRGWWW
jgi:hypothetical protein